MKAINNIISKPHYFTNKLILIHNSENKIKTSIHSNQSLKKFHNLEKKNNNNKTKIQSFQRISNKNFFDILGIRVISDLKSEQKLKEDEYFTSKEKLEFKKKKMRLTKIPNSFIKLMQMVQNKFVMPLWILSVFFAAKTLFNYEIFKFGISFASICFFTRMSFEIHQNKNYIITEMYLLENGKQVEIETFNHVFVVNIKDIRLIGYEEADKTSHLINKLRKNYIPLAIDSKLFLFRLDSHVYYKDVFTAVTESKYIKTNVYDDVSKNNRNKVSKNNIRI